MSFLKFPRISQSATEMSSISSKQSVIQIFKNFRVILLSLGKK